MESIKQSESLQLLIKPVADTLYVLSGKWKLPILIALNGKEIRFSDLARDIPNITDRMLSKELHDLELNLLIKRTVYSEFPQRIAYSLSEHGNSLHDVIITLANWGTLHRSVISQK